MYIFLCGIEWRRWYRRRSTHSSSSGSIEADEIVRDEKSRLVVVVMWDDSGGAGCGTGRYGTNGLSSVPAATLTLAALRGRV